MSSSVSPRQRDIGEVASLRAEGVDRQPQSGFSASLTCKFDKVAMLILFEPLRLRHLPYPRYRAAGEDIATYPLSTASNHNAQHAEENIARLPSFTAFSLLLVYS